MRKTVLVMKALLSNRRLLGVLLLLPLLVATTLVLIEDTVTAATSPLLEESVEELPAVISVQFSSAQNPHLPTIENLSPLVESVAALPQVSHVEPVVTYGFTLSSEDWVCLGVRNDSVLWDDVQALTGRGGPHGNECVVAYTGSARARAGPGDELVLVLPFAQPSQGGPIMPREIDVVGMGVWMGNTVVTAGGTDRSPPDVVVLLDLESFWSDILNNCAQGPPMPGGQSIIVQLFVSVNTSVLEQPVSTQALREAVLSLENQVLQRVPAPFQAQVVSPVEDAIKDVEAAVAATRTWALAQAVPVLVLIIVLVQALGDTLATSWSQELALLRIRGVERRGLGRAVVFEAIVLGCISGLAAACISRLIVASQLGVPLYGDLLRSLLIGVIVGGVTSAVQGTVVILRVPALRMTSTSRDEMVGQVVARRKGSQHTMVAWVFIALGLYKAAAWAAGVNVPQWAYSGVWPVAVTLLRFLWLGIDMGVDVVCPVLLMVGLALLLAESGHLERIREWSGPIPRGLNRPTSPRRRRRNTTQRWVLVALFLIVGSISWTLLVTSSEGHYALDEVRYQVGSDMNIMVPYTSNSSRIAGAVEEIAGVRATTTVMSCVGTVGSRQTRILAVDPSEWPATAYYEARWFIPSVTQAVTEGLSENESIVLERRVATMIHRGVGDRISVKIGGVTVNLTIVGLFGPALQSRTGIGGLLAFRSPEFGPPPPDDSSEGQGTSQSFSLVSISLFRDLNITMPFSNILVRLDEQSQADNVTTMVEGLGESICAVHTLKDQGLNVESLARVQTARLLFGGALVLSVFGTAGVVLLVLQDLRQDLELLSLRGMPIGTRQKLVLREIGATLLVAPVAAAVSYLCLAFKSEYEFHWTTTLAVHTVEDLLPILVVSVTLLLAVLVVLFWLVSRVRYRPPT